MNVYTDDRLVDFTEKELARFDRIIAAGGLVLNDEGQVLLIFRRGKWDLPKGKLEGNEPIELCAERETMEETGLTQLLLRRPLLVTYHTYTDKKKPVLKETHWYLFSAPGTQPLTPQTDEDIVEAIWVEAVKLPEYAANTYQLIRDVLTEAGFAL